MWIAAFHDLLMTIIASYGILPVQEPKEERRAGSVGVL